MIRPNVIVLAGYGLNCEDETAFAFEAGGAQAEIVHINDLVAGLRSLKQYQIMAIPGGFSYGDDTGSGKAYANKLKNHLQDELQKFVSGDRLVIGICNGFQVLTNTGLLPGVLTHNDSARYIDRWVDLKIQNDSPWLTGIEQVSIPIAHGEGNYYLDNKGLKLLKKNRQIAARYTAGEICRYQNLAANPNGALDNIAAVTSVDGKICGMMPHPERAMFFTQLPHWPLLAQVYRRSSKPLPIHGPGLQIFNNAVNYFK